MERKSTQIRDRQTDGGIRRQWKLKTLSAHKFAKTCHIVLQRIDMKTYLSSVIPNSLLLGAHGLPSAALQEVARATTLARLL